MPIHLCIKKIDLFSNTRNTSIKLIADSTPTPPSKKIKVDRPCEFFIYLLT